MVEKVHKKILGFNVATFCFCGWKKDITCSGTHYKLDVSLGVNDVNEPLFNVRIQLPLLALNVWQQPALYKKCFSLKFSLVNINKFIVICIFGHIC